MKRWYGIGRGQLLDINMQRFLGGLAFKPHQLCVSLNSRPESNKEEEVIRNRRVGPHPFGDTLGLFLRGSSLQSQGSRVQGSGEIQGFLAYTKPPPPRILQ